MSENYEIDFAVGYTFELMEHLVVSDANRLNMPIGDYIKKMENDYVSEVDSIFDALIISTDKEEIRKLIGEMLDSKCEWAAIDRYDFERKLSPGER